MDLCKQQLLEHEYLNVIIKCNLHTTRIQITLQIKRNAFNTHKKTITANGKPVSTKIRAHRKAQGWQLNKIVQFCMYEGGRAWLYHCSFGILRFTVTNACLSEKAFCSYFMRWIVCWKEITIVSSQRIRRWYMNHRH